MTYRLKQRTTTLEEQHLSNQGLFGLTSRLVVPGSPIIDKNWVAYGKSEDHAEKITGA